VFRFIATVWDPADSRAEQIADSLGAQLGVPDNPWTIAFQSRGLEVRYASAGTGPSTAYSLDGAAGVVLGTVFARSGGTPSSRVCENLSAQETRAIVGSRAEALVTGYWGRYVAFVRDPWGHRVWILRDPSGTLPCYSAEHGGVTVYFCLLQDYQNLGLHSGPVVVNWDDIALHLCEPGALPRHDTSLAGISQVLPGECVEWQRGRSTRLCFWDPVAIARTDPIEDPVRAVQALRRATLDVVHAWAGCHSSLLHAIGGLDSSLTLAALKLAPSKPRITCINYYSVGGNSDEREYVKEMVERAGCELITHPRDPALSLEPLLHMRPAPEPANYLYFLEASRVEGAYARQFGATAITSGSAGDQLFGRSAPFAASDYLARHPLGFSLFKTAFDQARREHTSVWAVLRGAVADQWGGRPWNPQAHIGRYCVLVRGEVIEAVKQDAELNGIPSPLAAPLSRWPRIGNGKLMQIQQLRVPPPFHNPLGALDDPEQLALLYSQPLIEICLRIPTDILTVDGWDRAIARRAFRSELPKRVVTRRWKGGFEPHARAVFLGNAQIARDLLLDGYLVKERILDRDRVEDTLRNNIIKGGANNAELFDCLSAEALIRRWHNTFDATAAPRKSSDTHVISSTVQI
jgi:asparagine synthase (glutamine-hydrolysing)